MCAYIVHLHASLKQWVFSHTPPLLGALCEPFSRDIRAMYTIQFSDTPIFQQRQCIDADTTSTISFYSVRLQIIIMMPCYAMPEMQYSLSLFFCKRHFSTSVMRIRGGLIDIYIYRGASLAMHTKKIQQHIFGIYALHFPSIADTICTWIWEIVNVKINSICCRNNGNRETFIRMYSAQCTLYNTLPHFIHWRKIHQIRLSRV